MMKKPKDLPIRRFSAALSRLNNALPLFPGGKEESKFSQMEIIQIMEWAVPNEWRSKFNLDSYTPQIILRLSSLKNVKPWKGMKKSISL